MNQNHQLLRIVCISLSVFLISTTIATAAQSPHLSRLSCPQYLLTLNMDNPIAPATATGFHLNHQDSESGESTSWVPKIVVPVVAIAVLGTATYLIFSQRGG
jgi:hypothetical protein